MTICLLGLPGLYQNWLLAAVDSAATIETASKANFETVTSNIDWIKFPEQEIDIATLSKEYDYVVNTYVSTTNFAWYLYNFLEKTDGVNIFVNNLQNDIFSKAPGTHAFDGMLKHFVDSYNISENSDSSIVYNSMIEYFYFLLNDPNARFKVLCNRPSTHHNVINIEYADFSSYEKLYSLLRAVQPNEVHFKNLYSLLADRNIDYLRRKDNFSNKLLNNHALENYDIMELAFIGHLIGSVEHSKLDWYNISVREVMFKKHQDQLYNYLLLC